MHGQERQEPADQFGPCRGRAAVDDRGAVMRSARLLKDPSRGCRTRLASRVGGWVALKAIRPFGAHPIPETALPRTKRLGEVDRPNLQDLDTRRTRSSRRGTSPRRVAKSVPHLVVGEGGPATGRGTRRAGWSRVGPGGRSPASARRLRFYPNWHRLDQAATATAAAGVCRQWAEDGRLLGTSRRERLRPQACGAAVGQCHPQNGFRIAR